jgi:hypothetical protein
MLLCVACCFVVVLLQTCFGSVAALGRAEGVGPWGVTVQCKPGLQGFSLDLLPDEWQEAADVQQVCNCRAFGWANAGERRVVHAKYCACQVF